MHMAMTRLFWGVGLVLWLSACGRPNAMPNKNAGAQGSECLADGECPPGERCDRGSCVPAQSASCVDHGDCDLGEECRGGICVERSAVCQGRADCPSGLVCKAGSCTTCSGAGDCAAGETCGPTGRCEAGGGGGGGGGTTVPTAWSCDPDWYADFACDCGCGVDDPDCAVGCTTASCAASDCEYCHDQSGDSISCGGGAGGAWTCDPAWYGDGYCDCGCGDIDADCPSGCAAPGCSTTACEFCVDAAGNDIDCAGGGSAGEWSCMPDWYADGACDCGCGSDDPDCATGCSTAGCSAADCDYCHDAGGDEIACGGTGGGSGGWTCQADYYGDGDCDCGCGTIDIDCPSGSGCASSGCSASGCDYCFAGGEIITCAVP